MTYFWANESEVCIRVADEAQDKAEDGLGNVQSLVMLNENRLHLVIVERLAAEFAEFVADVGKHRCLRVDLFILSTLCNNASFDILKQPSID